MSPNDSDSRATSSSAPKATLPLYHQIYLVLREQILSGEIADNASLPSEHQLRQNFSVSRVTIRRTLELLEKERLIERRQGVGTRATPHCYTPVQQIDLGEVTRSPSVPDGLSDYGLQSAELIDIPKKLERMFADYQKVVHLVRVGKDGDVPYSVANFYLPPPLMESLNMTTLEKKPVLTAIVESGAPLAKGKQTINAAAANELNAGWLGIPVGAPLLFMTGTFMDPDDKVICRTEGYFRPEHYEYRSTMYRKVVDDKVRWETGDDLSQSRTKRKSN